VEVSGVFTYGLFPIVKNILIFKDFFTSLSFNAAGRYDVSDTALNYMLGEKIERREKQ